MLPKCAIVCATAASTEALSVTSAATAMASPPSLAMMDAVSSCGFLHQVDAGNMGPFPCIGGGRSLAVAPARPRGSCPEHDGGLALQAINHALLPFPVSVPRAQRLRCHAVHFAGSHSSRVTSNVMQIGFEPAMKGPP